MNSANRCNTKTHAFIRTALFTQFIGSDIDWGFTSIPQKNVDDLVISLPRGKLLGGTSSVNGMYFVRFVMIMIVTVVMLTTLDMLLYNTTGRIRRNMMVWFRFSVS